MIASNNTILRYRIIDQCIRSSTVPYPSKEELRSACEEQLFGSTNGEHICDSTIEKDLFSMRMEHDAPIKYSRRDNGYYYTDPDYTIDEIPLNEKDINAIKTAATILYQFKNTDMFRNFDYAIDKLLDRINISSNAENEDSASLVQFEKVPSTKGGEFLEEIIQAIKTKCKLQFDYQSFTDDQKKIRRVHPYLLKEYRHRWYLIGKSEIKERIQTFGLDRISSLVSLKDHFTVDTGFDPDLFFKYSIGITANVGTPEKVIIHVDELLSKYLITQPLHESQTHEGIKDGRHVFSFFLLPTYELKMHILSFGSEIEVIEPQSLRDEIATISKRVHEMYS